MLRFSLFVVVMGLWQSTAVAAGDPYTFTRPTWICATPDDYGHAAESAQDLREKGLGISGLKKELYDAQKCMYVDDDDIEDLMQPFVQILARDGNADEFVKVSFTIEFYKKVEFLHRRMNRVTFAGWTHMDNLRDLSEYYQ